MNSSESLSSANLANWPGQPSEQPTQAPKVLEWKTLPANNGNEPLKIPYRWLCGRDEHGEPTNPIGAGESICFIPNLGERVNRANPRQSEWQGALLDHPVLGDSAIWTMPPLEIDLSAEAIQARITAYAAAKHAHETQIYQPDAVSVSAAAVQ